MKLLVFLSLLALAFGYKFTADSVKSELHKAVREANKPVVIDQCDKDVTEPYGVLEHLYKQSKDAASKCTWRLHAPAERVINVVNVSFELEDKIESSEDNLRNSTISIFDGAQSEEDKLLTRYFVSLSEKVGNFQMSQSTGRDMVVEVKYHDNKDFDTQRVSVTYEFVEPPNKQ